VLFFATDVKRGRCDECIIVVR